MPPVAVVAPRVTPASFTVIVAPASAVPVSVSVVSLVILSDGDAPVSSANDV